MPKINQTFVVALSAALIAVDAVIGVRMHAVAARRIEIKEDFGRVNSFKCGLLSVDVWKDAIQRIVAGKIEGFQFTEEQEKTVKFEIANVLKALIARVDVITQAPQASLAGSIQKSISRSFTRAARKNVPSFAQTVIDEIKKPENFKKLKDLARDQFNAYADLTHGNGVDAMNLNGMLAKYGAKDASAFNAAVALQVRALDAENRRNAAVMLGSLALFALAWYALRGRSELHKALLASSVAFAFVLLVTSLSIPMIEIDARIKTVDFQLMGDHLHFNDQVLYYRSKSLIQVVSTLMQTGQADSIGVGVLLLLFSILFPAAKLISTELYLLGAHGARKNKLIEFFALKSGKWSMADVTVVAIFMAFIGFRGIINNQLHALNVKTDSLESIATNATALQPGFLLFTAFVLFGIALSEILKRITADRLNPVPMEFTGGVVSHLVVR